jgi:hypothetical protein
MAAGAAQPTDGPRIDDLARGGWEEHEPGFGRSRRREARLPALVDDAQKDHPGAEFASAHQRPSATDTISAVDDLRLPRRARTICGNDIRVGVDGSRSLRRELGGDPMRVAVPHAPCDRGVRPRQLLENLHRLRRGQIKPPIGLGQENAEKSGTGQILRDVFRYPASGLDMVSLRDDTGPERARDL